MFVVLSDRETPRAQPGKEIRGEFRPGVRVSANRFPLGPRQLRWLVQYGRRDAQLADVVQQGGPSQAVDGRGRKSEFGSDHVGVDAHPLGVAAGVPVVCPQRADERQDLFGGGGEVAGLLARKHRLGQRLERREVAGFPGDREPGRRAAGKEHREIEQGGKRGQPARNAIDRPQRDQRAGEDQRPPADHQRERAGTAGEPPRG